MITICFNDEYIVIKEGISLMALLEKKNCKTDCYAIALNRQFIARMQYENTFLHENDIVEMIMPMQGG